MYFLMVINLFVHRFRFFLAHRSISMHANARGTKEKRMNKRRAEPHWPRERRSFAAWNPRFVSHDMKGRTERERDIEELEQVTDGTPDSFSEIMATAPKFVSKVPLRRTRLHKIKGGEKKEKWRKKNEEARSVAFPLARSANHRW